VETLLLSMEFEFCNTLLGVAQIRVCTLANGVPSKLGVVGLRFSNSLVGNWICNNQSPVAFVFASKGTGLEVNADKTKYTVMS
jgi:hypothetical protein